MFDTGWSLYSLAQEAHKRFGHVDEEAPVNTNLMEYLRQAQGTARTCVSGDAAVEMRLWAQIDHVIHELSKPLLQMLLYYVSVEDLHYSDLFALAFLPQVMTCNVAGFNGILSESPFQARIIGEVDERFADILQNLPRGLSCLRYTCNDLGITNQANEGLQAIVADLCGALATDFSASQLASYQLSDNPEHNGAIREVARLDLDLIQMGILMKANAISSAEVIFNLGRNSRATDYSESYRLVSLRGLSEHPIMQAASDVYNAYTDIYGNAFGGSLVREVLAGLKYAEASRLEKAQAVVRTIQTTVVYLNIVGRLQQSVDVCFNGNSTRYSEMLVDEAAALFIGSNEGSSPKGSSSNEGAMLMALGKEVCSSFDTCDASEADALSNQRTLTAFLNMKNAFASGDCAAAEFVLHVDLAILPVPMIQATIKLAYDVASPARQDGVRTGVDVISQAIIPLVNVANTLSAATLTSHLSYDPDRVVFDADLVVVAIAHALDGMGVDCKDIGTYDGSPLNTCNAVSSPVTVSPTQEATAKTTATPSMNVSAVEPPAYPSALLPTDAPSPLTSSTPSKASSMYRLVALFGIAVHLSITFLWLVC